MRSFDTCRLRPQHSGTPSGLAGPFACPCSGAFFHDFRHLHPAAVLQILPYQTWTMISILKAALLCALLSAVSGAPRPSHVAKQYSPGRHAFVPRRPERDQQRHHGH